MKPVVIFDANPLYGLRTLSGAGFGSLLALARLRVIRLVVPEVVVHELARQGAKEFNDKHSKLRNAVKELNDAIGAARSVDVIARPGAAVDGPEPLERTAVYEALVTFLGGKRVRIARYPEVSVAELLERDLDRRKPFSETGKGFRDALIWATIRELCAEQNPETPVLFVTNNSDDFWASKTKMELHPHLRDELDADRSFTVVEDLRAATGHPLIAPLIESLRTLDDRGPARARIAELVDETLSDLSGRDLVTVVGVWDGDVISDSPLPSALHDTAFNDVAPDLETIGYGVYLAGEGDERVVRVTVEADCEIEGYIDRSAYLEGGDFGFTYVEEENRYVVRAMERHRVRFALSGSFSGSSSEELTLVVDGVEEVVKRGER
ncbi:MULTISPECIES: PIN domain-containing protein [unclassified Microbacterium]|uniref:PIN domain-containing protein n=1 Tax=unclassified Microbacterium TaxID=2609290 RepID=UPI003016C299